MASLNDFLFASVCAKKKTSHGKETWHAAGAKVFKLLREILYDYITILWCVRRIIAGFLSFPCERHSFTLSLLLLVLLSPYHRDHYCFILFFFFYCSGNGCYVTACTRPGRPEIKVLSEQKYLCAWNFFFVQVMIYRSCRLWCCANKKTQGYSCRYLDQLQFIEKKEKKP